jgi:hypothetical protein
MSYGRFKLKFLPVEIAPYSTRGGADRGAHSFDVTEPGRSSSTDSIMLT